MGTKGLRWLVKRARRSRRIIEVGCWLGRSTKAMAAATRGTVWAVDHWAGTPDDPEQHDRLYADRVAGGDLYAEFCANLSREIAGGRVIPVRMPSVEAAAHLLTRHGPGYFDFIFIDADHSYAGCAGDIEAYRPLVAPGGLIAGHDYHWPGVRQAVDERFPEAVKGPRSLWSQHV